MIHSATNFTFIIRKYAIIWNKPLLISKKAWSAKILISINKTFNFLFFSLQICCHFQSENNTRNSSGFFLQNGGQSRRSQNDMLSFQCKTNLTPPSDTNIVYRYVLLVYSIIFAGQPLFTNFILLRSEDRDAILAGPEDICHFNDKTFYLPLYVSYHLCPLTENPYFVRSMTPSITIIQSRMIMMYFDPD